MEADNIEARPEQIVSGDLLYGVKAIAEFLGISVRQAQWWCDKGNIPTFRIGSKAIASRKTTLTRWMDEQEATAVTAKAPK